MVQILVIALLAMKHLFWMEVPVCVITTITLILKTEHIVIKELVNNVLINLETIISFQ